jgi:hypothetical protein
MKDFFRAKWLRAYLDRDEDKLRNACADKRLAAPGAMSGSLLGNISDGACCRGFNHRVVLPFSIVLLG